MKVYWWQGGLHIHPETKEESKALAVVADNLQFGYRSMEVVGGDDTISIEGDNQDSGLAFGNLDDVRQG